MTVLQFPRLPADPPLELLAWTLGRRWTAWHVQAGSERFTTACGIRVPAGVKVSRRQASPGHWPAICGGCKALLLLGQNRTGGR